MAIFLIPSYLAVNPLLDEFGYASRVLHDLRVTLSAPGHSLLTYLDLLVGLNSLRSISNLVWKSKYTAIQMQTAPAYVAGAVVPRRSLIASRALAGSGLLGQVDARRTPAAEVHPPGTCYKLRTPGGQNRAQLRLIIASHPFRLYKG
jgi:hypothetical protein